MSVLDEFLDVSRAELRFLESEFGFREQPIQKAKYHNEFSVRFENETTVVKLEGIGWGSGVNVDLGQVSEQDGYIMRGVPLWPILELRAPTENPNRGSQLDMVKSHAAMLHKHASDVLTGDFTVFPEVRRILDRRKAKLRQEEEDRVFESASIRASSAFHRKEFEEVMKILKPYESRLSDHQTKTLTYCEKHRS